MNLEVLRLARYPHRSPCQEAYEPRRSNLPAEVVNRTLIAICSPNSRYCVPISQCPTAAPEFDDWKGVKIDALLFGGRRADTVPLVTQAFSWNQGTMIGSLLSSGQTAAAEGKVGALRP